MEKIKIIIADNHRIFIEGFNSLLSDDEECELIDFAYDGHDLLNLLTLVRPNVILLDINMPRLNGLDAAIEIRKKYPDIKIILLTSYNEDLLIQKAKRVGVDAYLLKDCSKQELKQTIKSVMNNEKVFPESEILQNENRFIKDGFLKKFNITQRELEILILIKKGYTNPEMADQLFLSIYTIETHRKNIMHKLGVNNLAGLLKFIADNNIRGEE